MYSRNDTRVNDAHLHTLLSKMQKRTQIVGTCEKKCSSLPTTTSGCDEQNSSESTMAHIWKYAHFDNITCWKSVEHGWKFSHCDQMPQEALCEDDGSHNEKNDTDDERITPSKDESE